MIKKFSKKRMKQAMFTTLAVVMLSGTVLQNSSLIAQANSNSQTNNGYNDNFSDSNKSNEEFDKMIAELEQFVHVENGHFVFDSVPTDIQMKYGFDVIQALFEGAESLNDLVDEGELIILDDLSVIDLNESPASRNNINRSIQRWWGIEQWMTTTRARDFANALTNVATGYQMSGVLVSFIPGIGWAGAAAGTLGNVWYRNMASNVTNRSAQSNGRGIVVNMHWGFTYTTRVQ